MAYQTTQQLKKSVIVWRIASAVLFGLLFFIGMGNVNYSDQAKKMERSYQLEKARADYFKNQYDQIIESGTCLAPLPDCE